MDDILFGDYARKLMDENNNKIISELETELKEKTDELKEKDKIIEELSRQLAQNADK